MARAAVGTLVIGEAATGGLNPALLAANDKNCAV
jgi:hypothetical protein